MRRGGPSKSIRFEQKRGRRTGFTRQPGRPPHPQWKFVVSRKARLKRPNILQILLRSGTVNSAATTAEQRQLSDLLLLPALASVDLLDWWAFGQAVEIGYRCAATQLAGGALRGLV